MEREWLFRAVDTWFFRDSAPFEAGEGGRAGLTSLFPPMVFTLQGAMRTALALGQGWNATWNHRETNANATKLPDELGTSDDLGLLELRGPYLRYKNKRLYPLPSHVLYAKDSDGQVKAFVPLVPGESVRCDLSAESGKAVRLLKPRVKQEGLKGEGGIFITRAAMTRVLSGGLLDVEAYENHWYKASDLWSMEARIGLERDPRTRNAKEHQLYSTVHVRPGKDLDLEILESGSPQGWSEQIPKFIRLGGEGRMAEIQVVNTPQEQLPEIPPLKHEGEKIRFTVVLITPGLYENPEHVVRHGLPDVPGEVLSACIGKTQTVGGWDLAEGRSRPVRPLLPAGSIWFYEAGKDEEDKVKELHGQCLSDKELWTSYGFGQVLIGTWEGNAEEE
ncbi:MAG: type III-B CRISPR module-associated Cmr3 family protein [Desulfitobacteriaceae bacterium]